jgi:DNA-3-methyladenine glycosylase I
MRKYTTNVLEDIFKTTEKTLFSQSIFTKFEVTKAFEPFKQVEKSLREDKDYFWVIVYVTFYSGFKAKTVTDKIGAIQTLFSDIDKVAGYDETKVQEIIDSKTVIGHRQKINAIIYNAKQIKLIQKKFGSFDNYLSTFGVTDEETNLNDLIKDLKKRFKYLGGITVYHFLTDIGFNVVKPDRVLCRIFKRLGFVDSEDDFAGVIRAGRQISLATKLPIRYIDIIFVSYGQVGEKREFGLVDGICLSTNPKCELCGIYSYCQFKKRKKLQ